MFSGLSIEKLGSQVDKPDKHAIQFCALLHFMRSNYRTCMILKKISYTVQDRIDHPNDHN